MRPTGKVAAITLIIITVSLYLVFFSGQLDSFTQIFIKKANTLSVQ